MEVVNRSIVVFLAMVLMEFCSSLPLSFTTYKGENGGGDDSEQTPERG